MKSVGPRWQAAGLFALVVIGYLPALRAHWIWDDDYYVTNNATLRSADGLRRIWFEIGAVPQYYPLVHTTFWVEHHFAGLNPLVYHLDNVLLQAVTALLVWLVLRRLNVPGAWAAAAIWAVHPIQVETVAWVTERKNILSALFYFASGLVYLRFLDLGTDDPRGRKNSLLYGFALLLFVLALLSKTVACSLPAAILLVIWWKRGRITAREVWPLVPFFILGAGMGALTGWMERHFVGAQGPEWQISVAARCMIAGRALWFYVGRILCPWPLMFIYPRWPVNSYPGSWYVFPAAAVAVIIFLVAMHRQIGRGPAVAAMFFAGTLVPALGFVNTLPMRYSFVADHFQYVACLGVIAGIAAVLARKLDRSAMVWFCSVLLPCLVLLSWQRCSAFQDAESLWRDTLVKNPAAWMAHNNLGVILLNRNELAVAKAEFLRAIDLKHDHTEARLNLGVLAEKQGKWKEAERWYREALEVNPDYADAHFNLGGVLARQGEVGDAIEELRRAVQLKPDLQAARENLATLYLRVGAYGKAERTWREVLRRDSGNIMARNDLGISLAEQGKTLEAQRARRSGSASAGLCRGASEPRNRAGKAGADCPGKQGISDRSAAGSRE